MSEIKERLSEDGRTLPRERCPVCGYEFDCATCVDSEARPKPGDFSLCLKCGEILTFNSELHCVVPSVASLMNLPREIDYQLTRAQYLIRQNRFKG